MKRYICAQQKKMTQAIGNKIFTISDTGQIKRAISGPGKYSEGQDVARKVKTILINTYGQAIADILYQPEIRDSTYYDSLKGFINNIKLCFNVKSITIDGIEFDDNTMKRILTEPLEDLSDVVVDLDIILTNSYYDPVRVDAPTPLKLYIKYGEITYDENLIQSNIPELRQQVQAFIDSKVDEFHINDNMFQSIIQKLAKKYDGTYTINNDYSAELLIPFNSDNIQIYVADIINILGRVCNMCADIDLHCEASGWGIEHDGRYMLQKYTTIPNNVIDDMTFEELKSNIQELIKIANGLEDYTRKLVKEYRNNL